MRRLAFFFTLLLSWLVMGPASAQSCLGPGTYEEHDARITYAGTWIIYINSSAAGGSGRYSGTGAWTIAACPDVGAVVVYRYLSDTWSGWGNFFVSNSGGSYTVAIGPSWISATGVYNQPVTIPLTPGVVSTVQFQKQSAGYPPGITSTPNPTFTSLERIELLAAYPTAGAILVAFPTHTPTPTFTPTFTPSPTPTNTPGPSPTPTATATRTPNYVYQATVAVNATQSVDVALRYEVTAGDLFIGAGVLMGFGLSLVATFLSFRRRV